MTNREYLADKLRCLKNELAIAMNLNNEPIEHRYEQRGSDYTLRSWREKEMTVTASMVERPDWLAKIIDIAVVGGHIQTIPHPPPDLIVWFRTTPDNTLLEFIDFTNDTPQTQGAPQ